MKKIDLHIHTINTPSDPDFMFDFSKLKEYVDKINIDCIAITNHNIFDLEQYKYISENLSIVVLPGIEINLVNSHILLIADNHDLTDFQARCTLVNQLIQSPNDFLTVKILKDIFGDLSKYIIIPHYNKKPQIDETTLSLLSDFITAGEVSSPKKFLYCLKDTNSLVPAIFSDIRIADNVQNFPTSQTYVDTGEANFRSIKNALRDKQKVFLSKHEGNNIFDALDNGLKLSTGLNVIIGERSSGKTYTLKRLSKSFENIKYLPQFSLLERDEEKDKEKFNKLLSTKQSTITQGFLKEFKDVVDNIIDTDVDQNRRSIDIFINSLIKNASELDRADAFSKAALFNETTFTDTNLDNLKKLIDSTVLLIENIEYKVLINSIIPESMMKNLAITLMAEYIKKTEENLKKRWLNDLISSVKSSLQTRTAITAINDIDFYSIAMDQVKVNKFDSLVKSLKQDKEIFQQTIQSFKVIAKTREFFNASDLQKKSGKKLIFSNAYPCYNNPYEFLRCLKMIEGLEETEYYKYFVNIEYIILNKHNYEVSGGERSEFNLLNEINDALQFDMLLIDEPESSFDNLFLKNEVNELLKEISKSIPVVIVTHNSTVGASIKPNYVIYTRKEVVDGKVDYQIYSGYPSSKELISLDGNTIKNYEILINCLEAGQIAYTERGQSYEILKD